MRDDRCSTVGCEGPVDSYVRFDAFDDPLGYCEHHAEMWLELEDDATVVEG